MAKKETAEQKLLRMIEDGGTPAGAGAQGAQVAMAQNAAQDVAAAVKGTGISIPPVFSILSDKVQSILGMFAGKSFGLKQVNTVFIILIVVASLGLGFFYKSETTFLDRAIDFSKGLKESDMASAMRILPQYEPLASFLDVILKRNLFRPYEKKEEVVTDAPTGSEKVAAKIKDLKLVGISWLNTPDSASIMVENAEGVTIFLKKGDTISNVIVKKIFVDRVIFSYEDQEMEVRL